jgi:hypothetical protein
MDTVAQGDESPGRKASQKEDGNDESLINMIHYRQMCIGISSNH